MSASITFATLPPVAPDQPAAERCIGRPAQRNTWTAGFKGVCEVLAPVRKYYVMMDRA